MEPMRETVNGEQELHTNVELVRQKTTSIRVTNDIELEDAGQFLRQVNAQIKRVADWFKPLKDQANRAHKAICDRENVYMEPLKTAKERTAKMIGFYQDEQDRKRQEEERKAREEAERKEAAEREKLLKKAAKAEEKGNTQAAEELLQKAEDVYIPPATTQTVMAKPQGVSTRWKWDAEVMDKASVPEEYKVVDIKLLSDIATKRKGELIVPGVRFIRRAIVSGRG